jgi:SAM-dependent methyltransferase
MDRDTEPDAGWSGTTGLHWLRHQDRHEAMMAAVTPHLLKAAGLSDGERVIDIGCGCGQTSRRAARAVASGDVVGEVVGVDVSAAMIAEAGSRAAAEGLANVRFEVGDAEVFAFAEAAFDVVLSRFGIMFFEHPRAAFANLARALRPGGRLAFVCWQEVAANEHLTVPLGALAAFTGLPDLGGPDEPGPFSLADPARIRSLLEGAGFGEVRIEPLHERLRLGDDVADVLGYLAEHPVAVSMLEKADPATAEAARTAVADTLAPYQGQEGVFLGSAVWQVTARR